MFIPYKKIALFLLIVFAFSGCLTAEKPAEVKKVTLPPLRVGVTPNYPPMIFKLGDKVSGVEAEMAQKLGGSLGRPVEFVEVRWDEQIPSLIAGKIDIIMSGMTATEARKVRIDFTEPYMKSGLYTAMRTENVSKYDSLDRIKQSYATVGVMEGTTGDVFVQKNFPNAQRVAFSNLNSAAFALKRRSIDIFVHDGPAIAWLVSENEADLKGFWQPLNEEYLAWGISRSNQDLLLQVNALLRTWKTDGTLNQVLLKWLPYLRSR
ncbi:MAG: transporter substrate-binding domain-containing protein [bacterium]